MRCHAVNTGKCNLATLQSVSLGGTGAPFSRGAWPPDHPLQPPLAPPSPTRKGEAGRVAEGKGGVGEEGRVAPPIGYPESGSTERKGEVQGVELGLGR